MKDRIKCPHCGHLNDPVEQNLYSGCVDVYECEYCMSEFEEYDTGVERVKLPEGEECPHCVKARA